MMPHILEFRTSLRCVDNDDLQRRQGTVVVYTCMCVTGSAADVGWPVGAVGGRLIEDLRSFEEAEKAC